MYAILLKRKMFMWNGQLYLNNGGITMDAWKPQNPTYHNMKLVSQGIGVATMVIAIAFMCVLLA